MTRNLLHSTLFALLFTVSQSACSTISDYTDFAAPDTVEEKDVGVETPNEWDFLFAVELDSISSKVLSSEFSLNPQGLEIFSNNVLTYINNQIIVAKVVDLENYGPRLQFIAKGELTDSGSFRVDQDSDMLDMPSGDHGAGTYVFYHSKHEVAFAKGTVADCAGKLKKDIMVLNTSGPFITKTAANGHWAIPAWSENPINADDAGLSSMIYFQDNDCLGATAIGLGASVNEKTGVIPFDIKKMTDGTEVVDAGDVFMDIDISNGDEALNLYNLNFESGNTEGWSISSSSIDNYAYAAVLGEGYSSLFPEGDESHYLFITNGGDSRDSVTIQTRLLIPAEAQSLEVAYNILSQEYSEWVGSGFNDVLSCRFLEATDSIVERTINNAADQNLWTHIDNEVLAKLGNIANSTDAELNETGAIFDGMLLQNTRGGSIVDFEHASASYDLRPYAGSAVTFSCTLSDVGDSIYDTALVLDALHIK